MKEGNIKYNVNLSFEEIKLPPFQDILVVGKNSPHGKIGLSRSFDLLGPHGFELIELDEDNVEFIFINKNILNKVPSAKVMSILRANVFPHISPGEIIRVIFKVTISVDHIEFESGDL